MNFFAHGIRFLDRPWFVAGTAMPDWLSVADRPVRVRGRDAEPLADGSGTPLAEIAAGVLQHLNDDGWFHNTCAFHEVSGQLTRLFREFLTRVDDSPRAPFLGHIVTELLLDSILVEQHPEALEEYYRVLESLEPFIIQAAVNQMARRPTERLAPLIPLFCAERFLSDYPDSTKLWTRLNQVLRRVKLNPLPDGTPAVLDEARIIVASRRHELLPGFERWL